MWELIETMESDRPNSVMANFVVDELQQQSSEKIELEAPQSTAKRSYGILWALVRSLSGAIDHNAMPKDQNANTNNRNQGKGKFSK